MENGQFWITVWSRIIVALLLLVAILETGSVLKERNISKEILSGTHPILASCAHDGFGGSGGRAAVCIQALNELK